MREQKDPYPLEVHFAPKGGLYKRGCLVEKNLKKPGSDDKGIEYEQYSQRIYVKLADLTIHAGCEVEAIYPDEPEHYDFHLMSDFPKNNKIYVPGKKATFDFSNKRIYVEKINDQELEYIVVDSEGKYVSGCLDIKTTGKLTVQSLHDLEDAILEEISKRGHTQSYDMEHRCSESISGCGILKYGCSVSFFGSNKKTSILNSVCISKIKNPGKFADQHSIESNIIRDGGFVFKGFKKTFDEYSDGEEAFFLDIYVKEDLFFSIKENIKEKFFEGLSVSVDSMPGLYEEKQYYHHNENINYKLLDSRNDVFNSIELPDDFKSGDDTMGRDVSIIIRSKGQGLEFDYDELSVSDKERLNELKPEKSIDPKKKLADTLEEIKTTLLKQDQSRNNFYKIIKSISWAAWGVVAVLVFKLL